MKSILYSILLCFSLTTGIAQEADYNLSVRLSAEVSKSEKTITLNWPVEDAIDYNIFRKDPDSGSWGTLMGVVNGDEGQFVDNDVEVGKMYEYRVLKAQANGNGFGYMFSGIEAEPVHFRGRLLLLVDERFTESLDNEILMLSQEIINDGWEVTVIDIPMDSSVVFVKSHITNWYNEDPVNSKTLFLLGHIPVPYSGNINPDGHNDHVGAWSADVFYGDIDGSWMDQSVNNTTGSQIRTHNVPGDGKYDNSVIPSDLELEVGRVDFFNLPAFEESEEELLRKYISKNIAFRSRQFVPERRALIENNFGGFAEGFGQNGLRPFPTMFGNDNTSYLDYDNLLTESYMWSYGCGGGNYQGASGISNTTRLTSDSLQTVFTLLFGSYFGDFDSPNNFLRSVLGSGTVLTNAWAGRPNWFFHPMSMGQNIGYCAKLSQNNNFLYNTGMGARFVHMALMGDPSLRMHIVSKPENLTISEDNSNAILSWEAPNESVLGYYIYKSEDLGGTYQLLTPDPITNLSYTDSCLLFNSTINYLVKTAIIETSASGTYINLSPGSRASKIIETDNSVLADFETYIDGNYYSFTNISDNADSYFWDFGDGTNSVEENPVHFYEEIGDFTISLIASNECRSDTITQFIAITSTNNKGDINRVKLYPNPVIDVLKIDIDNSNNSYTFFDMLGNNILEGALHPGINSLQLNDIRSGFYTLKIEHETGFTTFRIIKAD